MTHHSFVACNETEQKENHQTNMLPSTPYTQVEKALRNNQATFLEFGSTECKSCIEIDAIAWDSAKINQTKTATYLIKSFTFIF